MLWLINLKQIHDKLIPTWNIKPNFYESFRRLSQNVLNFECHKNIEFTLKQQQYKSGFDKEFCMLIHFSKYFPHQIHQILANTFALWILLKLWYLNLNWWFKFSHCSTIILTVFIWSMQERWGLKPAWSFLRSFSMFCIILFRIILMILGIL